MIVIAFALIGAFLGTRLAARNGGVRADKVQYALACAIAGSLLGLIVTIAVEHLVA